MIYDVFVTAEGVAAIKMTLTAPACPAAQVLPGQVEQAAKGVAGVTDAKVESSGNRDGRRTACRTSRRCNWGCGDQRLAC